MVPYIEAIEGAEVVDDDMSVLHLPTAILDGKVTDGVIPGQLLHLSRCECFMEFLDYSVSLAGDILDQLHDVISCKKGLKLLSCH